MSDQEEGGRPVGRGARERIFAARARGCARLGASRSSGRSTRRRGRGARERASSHGRGARLPSWTDREPRGLRDSGGRPRRLKMQLKRSKIQHNKAKYSNI